jgi:hypothetical protein
VSFQEVTMYRIACDGGCGAHADDDGDFFAWGDKDQAATEADSADWLCRDDGHWCPRCIVLDDESGEYVPKPAKAAAS